MCQGSTELPPLPRPHQYKQQCGNAWSWTVVRPALVWGAHVCSGRAWGQALPAGDQGKSASPGDGEGLQAEVAPEASVVGVCDRRLHRPAHCCQFLRLYQRGHWSTAAASAGTGPGWCSTAAMLWTLRLQALQGQSAPQGWGTSGQTCSHSALHERSQTTRLQRHRCNITCRRTAWSRSSDNSTGLDAVSISLRRPGTTVRTQAIALSLVAWFTQGQKPWLRPVHRIEQPYSDEDSCECCKHVGRITQPAWLESPSTCDKQLLLIRLCTKLDVVGTYCPDIALILSIAAVYAFHAQRPSP